MAVTQIATATAALSWMFAEWIVKGKPSVLGIASGMVAGLATITPASGFVTVPAAFGIVGGKLAFLGSLAELLKDKKTGATRSLEDALRTHY